MEKTKYCKACNKLFHKLIATSKRRWAAQMFCSIKCSGTLIPKGAYPERLKIGNEARYEKLRNQKQAGLENNNWKGGVSWPYLKKVVLNRDEYTCQMCGHCEPEIMEVDHKKPKSTHPELAKTLDNLMTLCPNCHRRKTNQELREKGQNPDKQFSRFVLGKTSKIKAGY